MGTDTISSEKWLSVPIFRAPRDWEVGTDRPVSFPSPLSPLDSAPRPSNKPSRLFLAATSIPPVAQAFSLCIPKNGD